jgi:hypothetical protein
MGNLKSAQFEYQGRATDLGRVLFSQDDDFDLLAEATLWQRAGHRD